MNYSTGYISSFYGMTVDPITWKDVSRFEIISGSIDKDISNLRESANLVLNKDFGVLDQWIRVYMDIKQSGDVAHIPLFTGLGTSPSVSYDLNVSTYSLQCYSVLKPLEDILLPKGWFATTNVTGTEIVKQLLSRTPAPVRIESDSKNLVSTIVAEGGETNLTMLETILPFLSAEIEVPTSNSVAKLSTDLTLVITGNGEIVIRPVSNEPVSVMSAVSNDIVTTSFSKDRDFFDCPNVLRVQYEDKVEIVKDDDPDSILSTVSRGREIWASEDISSISQSESLNSYARRKLAELQAMNEYVNYTRRFLPNVYPGDLVRIKYPDLDGDFRIESQSIELTPGAPTSEKAYRSI